MVSISGTETTSFAFNISDVSGGQNNTPVSGSGDIWGDPHFDGAQGQHYDIQGQAGNVYNLLTDNGIQVTGKFQSFGNGNNTVGEMGVVLDGNKIDIKPGGQLTINGQAITADGSYLNGAVTKNGNTITINAPNYAITVKDGGGYLNTDFVATNAGQTQTPGGLWGQSLTSKNVDMNANDFRVASTDGNVFGQDYNTGGDIGSINTNFSLPTLPSNASTSDVLNFEKAIMEFSTQVSAVTTAINTIGNVEKGISGKMAQG